jgi:hypothetical protein
MNNPNGRMIMVSATGAIKNEETEEELSISCFV